MFIRTSKRSKCGHDHEALSRRDFLRSSVISLVMPPTIVSELLSKRAVAAPNCPSGSPTLVGSVWGIFDQGAFGDFVELCDPTGAPLSAANTAQFGSRWGFSSTPNFVQFGKGSRINIDGMLGNSFWTGPSLIPSQIWQTKVLPDVSVGKTFYVKNDDGAGDGEQCTAQGIQAAAKIKLAAIQAELNLGGGNSQTLAGFAPTVARLSVTPSATGLAQAVSFPSPGATSGAIMAQNSATLGQLQSLLFPLGSGKAFFNQYLNTFACGAQAAQAPADPTYGTQLFNVNTVINALNQALGTNITAANVAAVNPSFIAQMLAAYRSATGDIMQASFSLRTSDEHAVNNNQRGPNRANAGQMMAYTILGFYAAGVTHGATGAFIADGAGSAGGPSSTQIQTSTVDGVSLSGSVPLDGNDDGQNTTAHFSMVCRYGSGGVPLKSNGGLSLKTGTTDPQGISGGSTPTAKGIADAMLIAGLIGGNAPKTLSDFFSNAGVTIPSGINPLGGG